MRAAGSTPRGRTAGAALALIGLVLPIMVLLLGVLLTGAAPAAAQPTISPAEAIQQINDADPPGRRGSDLVASMIGSRQVAGVPSAHYEVGAAPTTGDRVSPLIGRTLFALSRWMVALGLFVVRWALTFEVGRVLAQPAEAIGRQMHTGLVGPLQLIHIALLLAVAAAAWNLLRQRHAQAMSGLAVALLIATGVGAWISDGAGGVCTSLNALGGSTHAIVLLGLDAGVPSTAPDLCGAAPAEVPLPVEDIVHDAFVAAPFNALQWGDAGGTGTRCRQVTDALLRRGAWGDDDLPRRVLTDVGCEEAAEFNGHMSSDRLLASSAHAVITALFALTLAAPALAVVVAQVAGAALITVAPVIGVIAIAPGAGRRLAAWWVAAAGKVALLFLGAGVVLVFLTVGVTAVLEATAAQPVMLRTSAALAVTGGVWVGARAARGGWSPPWSRLHVDPHRGEHPRFASDANRARRDGGGADRGAWIREGGAHPAGLSHPGFSVAVNRLGGLRPVPGLAVGTERTAGAGSPQSPRAAGLHTIGLGAAGRPPEAVAADGVSQRSPGVDAQPPGRFSPSPPAHAPTDTRSAHALSASAVSASAAAARSRHTPARSARGGRSEDPSPPHLRPPDGAPSQHAPAAPGVVGPSRDSPAGRSLASASDEPPVRRLQFADLPADARAVDPWASDDGPADEGSASRDRAHEGGAQEGGAQEGSGDGRAALGSHGTSTVGPTGRDAGGRGHSLQTTRILHDAAADNGPPHPAPRGQVRAPVGQRPGIDAAHRFAGRKPDPVKGRQPVVGGPVPPPTVSGDGVTPGRSRVGRIHAADAAGPGDLSVNDTGRLGGTAGVPTTRRRRASAWVIEGLASARAVLGGRWLPAPGVPGPMDLHVPRIVSGRRDPGASVSDREAD